MTAGRFGAAYGSSAPVPSQYVSAAPAPSSGASGGVIAAAVIGSLVGATALAGLGYWLYRRKREGNDSHDVALTFNSMFNSQAVDEPYHGEAERGYQAPDISGAATLHRRAI